MFVIYIFKVCYFVLGVTKIGFSNDLCKSECLTNSKFC